jgi:hypothetical protein
MNKQRTIQEYAQFIEDIYRAYGLEGHLLRQALKNNVFMITINFDKATFAEGESRSDSQTYLKRYGDWLHSLIRISFGNHPIRKKQFQPVSLAFVDYPGSRKDKYISSDELRRHGRFHKLHIHAIIALKPDGQEFRRSLMAAGSGHQLRKYGDVMVEAFDPAKGSLKNMIEYCAKGAMGVDHGWAFGDMWDVFPKFRDKTKVASANHNKKTVPDRAATAASVRGKQRFLLGQKLGQINRIIKVML